MLIGMLWFNNDPKMELEKKIEDAVHYYETKHGKRPNLCYVHPSMTQLERVGTIEIKKSRSVLPNHFWIGVE